MAYLCVKNNAVECSGCGGCNAAPQIIGECVECGDLIYDFEGSYDIEGELIHKECLEDWAKKYEVVL